MRKKILLVLILIPLLASSSFAVVILDNYLEWNMRLPSMSEAFSDYFSVGNIMEPKQTWDPNLTAMYTAHYNFVTAENAMKPAYVAPEKGRYNFENTDTIVEWAEKNNLQVHGHTLVWHSQSAPWLTSDDWGDPLTREEAKANMAEYINTVAGRYAGRIASWDVVNEAFTINVGRVPDDWKDALRGGEGAAEQSPWFLAYENGADASKGESGGDYLYDAFVLARLAAPDATLYYNDFNESMTGKCEVIARMAEDLNAQWKNDERNTEPDRLLVEGIGMQSHFWTSSVSIPTVEKSIQRFIETGAEISISELDITHGNWNTYKTRKEPLTEEEDLKQAEQYAKLMALYMKYSDSIVRVSFWGKADDQSWRREGFPLLFDSDREPKKAYWSVMALTGIEEGALLPEPPSAEPTAAVPVASEVPEAVVSPPEAVVSPPEENTGNSEFPMTMVILAGIAGLAVISGIIFLIMRRK